MTRQFGNILVLAATFMSDHLAWLIQKDELLRLLNRTVNFLSSLEPISTTLAEDVRILKGVRNQVEGSSRSSVDMPHIGSSFGSMGNR